VDCSNYTINHCHIKNNTKGLVTVLGSGITVQASYLNNNTEAISAQNCTNLQIDSSSLVENEVAINAAYTTLSANDLSVSDNLDAGIRLSYSDLTAYNSEYKNNLMGLYSIYSNFSVTNSSISDNFVAGILSGFGDTTLLDCVLDNNNMYGILSLMSNITKIENCGIRNNEYGIAALYTQNFQLTDSLIFNNSYVGLMEELGNNTRLVSNNFTQNGLDTDNLDYGAGALMQVETNCTVTDNVFKNNYDALMLGEFDEEVTNTQTYHYNTFDNNSYTFDFNYNVVSNITGHKLYFYNNYVNDVGYVSPISFGSEMQVAPAVSVFYLNTTLQAGNRVTLDGGRMIGGNYWAHPNGTGPSQTGVDADHDGFLDTPFDLLGNHTVIDYLPYSSSFQEKIVKLSISPETASVKAGETINYTATATDMYGNSWNVTADYAANGNQFSGSISAIYPGAYSIQASYGDQTATATLYVTPGDVERYVVITPTSVTTDAPFTIRIVAVDAHNNIVTDYSGTVSLCTSSGTVTPSASSAFSYGTWIGNITVSNLDAESFTISASDGSGNTGVSSTVTVIQETTEPTPTPTPTQSPTTQPTANPTDSTGTADSYWWAWYAIPTLVLLALVAAGVYFIKRPKTSLTK